MRKDKARGQGIKFETDICFGDKVILDGDASTEFTLIAVQLYPSGHMFKLSWFQGGGSHSAEWFDSFRVSLLP